MKNLIFLNRSGMGPDGTSRKGRYSLDPILSRLCLASLICLCMLTIGSGNVWGANAAMTGGSNATASKFSSADGYKCGTGSAGGSMTVTIPAGATVLSVYIAGWSGDNPTVSISRNSGTISSSSVSPTCDSGISGSGTSYTLANAESTYLQTFTLSSVNSQTTVTFSTSSKKKRFGVWGAKICYSPTSPTNTTIGSTTATLGWSDAKNVNSYEVYYSTSSTPPTASSSGTTTTSKSINLTSLTSSQQYYWWVRAYDSYCKTAWVAGTSFTTTSAGTSVSLSKAATSNGSFTLSPASSVTTTSSAQTVTVTCSPNAGYYVSAISATNPATCPSAITYGGSNNSRTVTYPTGANGSSTISVTFSPIWYLKGSFNTWGETNPCTVADGIATATVSLAKNTKYEFQFYDKQNSTWYYNGGNIVEDISGWTFTGGTGSNCKIFTGKAGTYTFKINTSTKAVQVIYQAPSHPDDAYVYFKKWADWSDNYFVHWWDGSGNTVQDYNSAIRVTKTYSTCDNDYVCFPILADYTNFLVKDAASGDGSHKSGDLTSNSNAAKYYDFESWKNFTTYDINFGGNGNTGGSMSSITDLCPGAEQALTPNAFTKTHYSFSCWHADVAVKVGESTISAGGDISNGATIKDIQSNINLTAQWSPVSYTITKTFTNVANAGLPASFTYTGSTTTALNSSFTVDATNFFLPSSITVTMGGSTLTKDTHYTYNNSTGAFTFDVAITGNIVITATAVPKLKSIAITSQPTTRKYLVGDVFSSTGAVVTATMGDGNTKTVSATWTPSSALSAGTGQIVTASYTENGINQTATTTIDVYSVTVNKVNMSGTAITNANVTATCSGRTLSQSVGSTNYKFNSWNVTAGGVTVSTNTITGTPTGNVTINAKFHDPITVTWKVGSGAASGGTGEVKYGTAIAALPSTPADNALASCGTNKFMGWTAAGELKGTGHGAPADLFTTVGGATALTENTTYRAVFASSTSGAAANTVLFSENWTGVTASTKPSSPSASGSSVYGGASISYSWADGGTTTQTYSDGGPNGNANILISKSNGYWKASGIKTGNASKIVFTYAKSGSGALAVSSPTSNVSVEGSSSGSYITFTDEVSTFDLEFKNTNGSNNLRLDDIVVKVYTAGTTAVDYQTGCCEAPASALSITSANSVATGGTVSLTSTGGNGGTVTWSVVNGSGTATVAGSTLTAGNVGTVTVKAHQDANTVLGTEYCAQDAEQAFTVVSSTVNVTGVEVSPTSKAIVPGETFDITPTISPSNATDKSVSWTSSASDKASVSSGTVTGVAAGTATITCETTDGGFKATCAVTVRDVTLQARDEDGNTIAAGGPGAPSRSGATITAAANAGNYVFKQWQVTNASVASTTTTPTTISNPTGAVTVTAVYYKPRVVKWSVNGNDSYTAGGATTAVAYNGTISTVPTNPSGLACASTFIAWTDAAHNNGQTAKDDDSYYESKLFTDAGDFPNITAETTTFYAVFAEKTNSDGYKYIGDDGTLADGKKYIFVSSKSAGSTKALKATDLPSVGTGTLGTAVDVTVTSNAEGVLVTTVNTDLEFEYVSSGTKLKYVVSGPTTRYLFVNGSGVGYKADDSRSRYTTAGLQGWNNAVSTYYDVYYNGSTGYTKAEGAASRVYAFIKQTATYGNYVTECDPNIVSVTYDANGGATSCANTTTDKTEDFTVCSSAPTRDYYTFAGWLCSADDEVYAASATIDDAVIDADFTLTAQWTPVPYSITYELYGGTNSGSNPATYNVTTATITLQDPSKGHDRFEGWYSTYSAGVYSDQVTSIPLGSHGDITLHAKWAARHEIIFDADGTKTTIYRADDENMEDAVAGQGSVPSDPDAPTACSSKVFMGWSESTIDGETDTKPGDLMKPAAGTVDENKHYYAVWAIEESSSGTETIFTDDFNVTGTDEVTSRSGWTDLSTVYGGSGSIRFSSGKNAGSMTLDVSGMEMSGTWEIKFKIKKYGTDDEGALAVSSAFEDLTTSFSPTSVSTTDGANWTEKTITVTGVHSGTEIHFDGTTNSRVYVKDVEIKRTGTITTHSAYSTSCCATKITLSVPSITDAASSGSTITFDKSSPVFTCDGTKTVTATLTLTAGYQASALSFAVNSGTVSISPAISTPITSSQVYTLTFAEDQNATLTTTATIAAKPLNSITITPSSGEVYVGQYVDFTVSYDPADYLSKGYTLNATPVYVTKESAAPANTKLRLKGGRGSGPGASITETVNETVTIKASGDNTKTASVNMTVNPLPKVHFADNVHNESFSDVVATIVENALSATKQTPTHADYTGSTLNTCEEQHLHLVGWIDGDWDPYKAYMNGTGAKPDEATITGATGYFYAPGADIDVSAKDGKTYYAVWAIVE